MTECRNCGSSVADGYVRVFVPDGVERPRVCPHCEADRRDDTREVRSARH